MLLFPVWMIWPLVFRYQREAELFLNQNSSKDKAAVYSNAAVYSR
jgi:hypothetical protein